MTFYTFERVSEPSSTAGGKRREEKVFGEKKTQLEIGIGGTVTNIKGNYSISINVHCTWTSALIVCSRRTTSRSTIVANEWWLQFLLSSTTRRIFGTATLRRERRLGAL